MKKFYSLVVASVIATGAFAQCTVNPLSSLTVLSPLPTEDLPTGYVGTAYQGNGLSISFNASGQTIDPAIVVALLGGGSLPIPANQATFAITRVEVVSTDGVPAGMTLASTSNPTVWNEGQSGCFLLSGTPTVAGEYDITFNTNLTIEYTLNFTGTTGSFDTPQPAPVPYKMNVVNNASISEFAAAGLNLFPNPANEMFTISYPATGADMATIDVTDLSGKVVYSSKQSVNTQGGNVQISVDGLATGMYRVTFNAGDIHTASKLVVRK